MTACPGQEARADPSLCVDTLRRLSTEDGAKSSDGLRLGSRFLASFTLLLVLVVPRSGHAQSAVHPEGTPSSHKALSARAKAKSESTNSSAASGTGRPAASGKPASSRKGPAPKQPSAVAPEGTPRAQSNLEARRAIAGGSTDDERAAPLDAELQVLQEAERTLFPRPLSGVHPGWSWDLENTRVEPDGPPGTSILPPDVETQPSQHSPAEIGKWLSELALPNLPTGFQPNVVTYLQFYRNNAQGKSILRTWCKRSGRYAKVIIAELAKAGLPTDLLWQSVIESGFNPLASPKIKSGLE